MAGITIHTDSDLDAVFKKHYLTLTDNLYSTFDKDYSRAKKTFGTLGAKDSLAPVETTFGGGYGGYIGSTLPESNHSSYINPVYTAKRTYARVKIDNLTIEGSQLTEDAFIKMIDKEVVNKVRNFNRNHARAFTNDGTGILGQVSGNFGGTAAAPTHTILNTGSYRRRRFHFEPNEIVQVVSGGSSVLSSLFTVTSYVASTGVITLARYSGSDDLTAIGAGTHNIVSQYTNAGEPMGLLGMATLSTYYGVAAASRWQPTSLTVSPTGRPLDSGDLTDLVENLDTETGETPSDILMSPTLYRKYIKILEDQKRFPVPVTMRARGSAMTTPELIAKVGYGGIQYVGPSGNINVSKNVFLREDMIFAVNFKYIEIMHVKKPAWGQRDGTVFLRIDGKDAYEATYKCYSENRFNPFYIGYGSEFSIT